MSLADLGFIELCSVVWYFVPFFWFGIVSRLRVSQLGPVILLRVGQVRSVLGFYANIYCLLVYPLVLWMFHSHSFARRFCELWFTQFCEVGHYLGGDEGSGFVSTFSPGCCVTGLTLYRFYSVSHALVW